MSQSSRQQLRVVPWTGIPEWEYVFERIFSENAEDVEDALVFAEVWLARGNTPPAVESTVNILKLKAAFQNGCMDSLGARLGLSSAVVRFVNEVVDPNQRATYALPISQLAERAGIPRLLVDIRHSATHNELPGLEVLLYGAYMALDWLRENYWEPQKNFKVLIRETTHRILGRYVEGLKDCDPLTKSAEGLASRCLNELQHIEYSPEIQMPFLTTVLESSHPSPTIVPILEALAQKDESSLVCLLEIACSESIETSRMDACIEAMTKKVRKVEVITDCAKKCLVVPTVRKKRLLKLILQNQKTSLPERLRTLLQELTLKDTESTLAVPDLLSKAHQALLASSHSQPLPDGWSVPERWTPIPFGRTESFDPITQFQEFIVYE